MDEQMTTQQVGSDDPNVLPFKTILTGLVGIVLAIGFQIGWVAMVNQYLAPFLLAGVIATLPMRLLNSPAIQMRKAYQVLAVVIPAIGAPVGFVLAYVHFMEWASIPEGFTLADDYREAMQNLLSLSGLLIGGLSIYLGYIVAGVKR
ncbi:hypothetical protein KS4_02150 [Poriferisphaera corsica]|uniref:Uncharacterized protein n=1 Tax=Poriferisphaera corsica TaxID=2528020 RepID=A0A517YPN7_9BACT|nr:hypothetical protein [Poriferisphaera corsica]QDU32186.1 hypothetical protein KS4_02150 [Poriferisphaera corsica]